MRACMHACRQTDRHTYIYTYIHICVPWPSKTHKIRRVALKTQGFKTKAGVSHFNKFHHHVPRCFDFLSAHQFQGVPTHVLKHGFTRVKHGLAIPGVPKKKQGFHQKPEVSPRKTRCTPEINTGYTQVANEAWIPDPYFCRCVCRCEVLTKQELGWKQTCFFFFATNPRSWAWSRLNPGF